MIPTSLFAPPTVAAMAWSNSYRLLPTDLLKRASLRGREYAWALADIPLVIASARKANLVNIGGQLQFRIHNGGTCECHWIAVDTYKTISKLLPWRERAGKTYQESLAQFHALTNDCDFVEEGRRAFGTELAKAEAAGAHLEEIMCFTWYVLAEDEALSSGS